MQRYRPIFGWLVILAPAWRILLGLRRYRGRCEEVGGGEERGGKAEEEGRVWEGRVRRRGRGERREGEEGGRKKKKKKGGKSCRVQTLRVVKSSNISLGLI